MDYPNLTAEVLTGVVTGIKVNEREFPLSARFGGGGLDINAPGLFTKWDEIQPQREIVKSFESRGAIATPTDPQGVKTKAAALLLSFKKRTLDVEALDTLRVVGGTSADRDAAQRNVDLMTGDMDRRYRMEPMEYLFAGALQDNISITVDGVAVTPDYGLAGSHDLTAGASWATAGTDIDADVETMKRLIEQDSGETPEDAYCGRNVFGYFRKNTAVKTWLTNFVGADQRFDRMVTGETLNLFGLTWRRMSKGYLSSGTWTPYLGDDKVVMTPAPSQRWFQVHKGIVRFPTDIFGGVKSFGQTYGVAVWSQVRGEPPGITFFHRWAGLPILVFPSAVVNLDTTP